MAECEFCEIRESKKELLFSDENIAAFLSRNAAVPGHTVIIPKQHFTILEQIPDSLVRQMFQAANKFSTLLFEGIGAQGTNVIVENGNAAGQKTAHLSVNVLPRAQNDNLNFQWQPKKLSEAQSGMVEVQLKSELDRSFQEPEVDEPKLVEKSEETIEHSEDDYLMRQLNRMP